MPLLWKKIPDGDSVVHPCSANYTTNGARAAISATLTNGWHHFDAFGRRAGSTRDSFTTRFISCHNGPNYISKGQEESHSAQSQIGIWGQWKRECTRHQDPPLQALKARYRQRMRAMRVPEDSRDPIVPPFERASGYSRLFRQQRRALPYRHEGR